MSAKNEHTLMMSRDETAECCVIVSANPYLDLRGVDMKSILWNNVAYSWTIVEAHP